MKIAGWLLAGLSATLCLNAQIADRDLPAVAQAQAHFAGNAAKYGLTNPQQELKARKSNRDSRGAAHVRFDQFFKGVKVFEGEAIAHVDGGGQVTVTDSIRRGLTLDTKPSINRNAAEAAAVRDLGLTGAYDVQKGVLEILLKGRVAQDTLTWHFQVFTESDTAGPSQWDVFVDARTGAVAWKFESLESTGAVGTGQTMYSGTVTLATDFTGGTFYLRDLTRASSQTTDLRGRRSGSGTLVSDSADLFGNGSVANTDPDTAAADAHYGLAMTWDYYKTVLGRNGIDGFGRGALSRVHYGRQYENAFWSDACFCMTYGDGATTFYPLVELDVAGHEMSHGVMSTEANLTYSGESGGLNEANSDIFGTLVEFYANNAADVPDYWIGERILRSNYSTGTYVQTRALRYMDDPAKDGASPACWSSTIGSLNVHYSSGPANHMFWLLSNPAANVSKCTGQTVNGIGRDKAGKIWYEAISNHMTSSTDYKGARAAALSAALALGYTTASVEYKAVAAAFSAINVN